MLFCAILCVAARAACCSVLLLLQYTAVNSVSGMICALLCVAVCCSVLQCVAVCCSEL